MYEAGERLDALTVAGALFAASGVVVAAGAGVVVAARRRRTV
ncbi:hypothetical protein [Streptomyces sp. NBC_00046]